MIDTNQTFDEVANQTLDDAAEQLADALAYGIGLVMHLSEGNPPNENQMQAFVGAGYSALFGFEVVSGRIENSKK